MAVRVMDCGFMPRQLRRIATLVISLKPYSPFHAVTMSQGHVNCTNLSMNCRAEFLIVEKYTRRLACPKICSPATQQLNNRKRIFATPFITRLNSVESGEECQSD